MAAELEAKASRSKAAPTSDAGAAKKLAAKKDATIKMVNLDKKVMLGDKARGRRAHIDQPRTLPPSSPLSCYRPMPDHVHATTPLRAQTVPGKSGGGKALAEENVLDMISMMELLRYGLTHGSRPQSRGRTPQS